MHVAGDLGFSSLVLVFCLVFPVIGLVIRRKWRFASAKQEEIKRLLILASEEARRAEEEAFDSYGVVPPSSTNYQCAVCFSPTTTRCARCKAVRYCSGKCQIVHWRQGHKEECHLPDATCGINNEGNDGDQKVTSDQHEIYGERFEMEYIECSKQIENDYGESTFSGSSYSPEVLRSKDEDINVEFDAVGRATDLTSESSSTSFSGFSATSSRNESSDDLSVSESVSSNEIEEATGYLSADNDLDMLGMTSNAIKVDRAELLSSNFTNLVDSVDSFNKLGKLNNYKPSPSNRGSQHVSSKSSVLSQNPMPENSNARPCKISSGFWGRALDTNGSPSQARSDSAVSNSTRAGRGVLSDSESLARLSFNFLADNLHLQTEYSVEKDVGTGDVLPASRPRAINKHADTAANSENAGVDDPKVMNISSSNCGRSKDAVNDFSHDSYEPKSREVESVLLSSHKHRSSTAVEDSFTKDTSKVSRVQSAVSARTNRHVNDTAITSHLAKSGDVERLSSVSQANLASTCDGHSLHSVKSGNFNGVQTVASSQVTSFPNSRPGLKTSMLKVVDQFTGSKLSKHHSLGNGGEGAERYDKGFFPYELFVKLYTWNKIELRPCGLVNCGNSCYANAVLQCLAFTPPLTAYFLQGLHSNACGKKGWCFTCEFESIILKVKEGKSPLSPIGILSKLQNFGRQLGNGREEDAHEFLRYAIDAMQSVCLLEAGVSTTGSPEEETTLIGLTFGGYLRSKIKCARCQVKSERHERMMDLTVEIEGDIQTLEEALRRFTATEILDGDNKYQCSRCKSYEKAKKKLTILEAPNVLTIALKRFQSGKFGKLNKAIRFPEILDLAPYMSGTSDKSPSYRLFGVVVHLDIMNASFSGHYVCYIKTVQNKWFKIDDSTVTPVELERVLTKGAYMLLYARCSPRAPKLIRNRMTPSDAKIKTIPSMVNGKNASAKSSPRDNLANYESFYTKFHHIQRILGEDSSSDNYSFTSSNSDEGSCSTDSNRGSTSTDDFSDFIFGDSGRVWSNSWKIYSDSDTSSSSSLSSSSPSYLRHPQLADPEHCAPGPPETSGSRAYRADSAMKHDGWDRRPNGSGRLVDLEGKGRRFFLHSDSTKQCRKSASTGSSSFRERDSERLGRNTPFDDVKSGVFRERTS
ncbi:Ubiquitin-specific protease 16 putative isoform 1 [Tripterygium wilfordii]|uniref:ubiquitinyl hydrolase 1 n=1 Tax=Tripterygium wilfordii TaxID=458696 RepID=A0A7J7D1C8_TRIWF|nr:ubiquitin carboxyl-terminal hydrolase 16-like [Tripterygium wilfordii]XP_038715681.1 ubiquitin carboxyl-terminal hydrolase 16-like [Tripterygium wilfordii]KAF5740157.1 Ubiquitin-specific protease 16 putative isoform 1 [Tripterygium wilfordii]